MWPLVVLKELVDNAIDAGTTPVVSIKVDGAGITVEDNGPGLPAKTIKHVLDFSVRVSSREAYVSPTRGAQGNALKTMVAMPFVVDHKRLYLLEAGAVVAEGRPTGAANRRVADVLILEEVHHG